MSPTLYWFMVGVIAGVSSDPNAYLRYVHPTIREPFPDLVSLTVPTELEDQRTATMGLVDVTKGPFRADPSGREDSTRVIQAAIYFARDHQMACFFPPGTYHLRYSCLRPLYRDPTGAPGAATASPTCWSLASARSACAGLSRCRLRQSQKPKLVVYFEVRL
jgi:hypothetical protein